MLNDLEEHQEAERTDKRTRLMLECLSQIRYMLPLLAQQALQLAQQYSAGIVPLPM